MKDIVLLLYGICAIVNLLLGAITGKLDNTIIGVLWMIAGEIRVSYTRTNE